MSEIEFNPWDPPGLAADWQPPERRLAPAEARALLDGIDAAPPGAPRAGRALRLVRALWRTLALARGSPEDAELLALWNELGRRALSGDPGLAIPQPAAWVLDFEIFLSEMELKRIWKDPSFGSAASAGLAAAEPPDGAEDGMPPGIEAFWEFQEARMRAAAGEASRREALELFRSALGLLREEPARAAVLLALVRARFSLAQHVQLEPEARELARLCAGSEGLQFEGAFAQHFLAFAFARGGRWEQMVEAARQSNVALFAYGTPQSSPWVRTNYYLAARGMLEQREWSEAAILAELSLKGGGEGGPGYGRPERILTLAKALHRLGERTRAKEALERLVKETPPSDDARHLIEEAEDILRALS